jgi:hypothetical protein
MIITSSGILNLRKSQVERKLTAFDIRAIRKRMPSTSNVFKKMSSAAMWQLRDCQERQAAIQKREHRQILYTGITTHQAWNRTLQ